MKTPKPPYQRIVDRYLSVNHCPPTWADGYRAALEFVEHQLWESTSDEMRETIKQALARIDQIESEE